MYYVDANLLMNWVVAVILGTGALLLLLTLYFGAIRRRSGRGMSHLYMLTALFGCFAVAVAVLGFRGRTSGDRPWHFFLDMKYQPKYTAQGQSNFFPDGRAMRLPLENTVPFDGTDYAADAGFHAEPKADFLKADPRYYRGIADPTAKVLRDGVELPKEPEWKDGQMAEAYYVARIPEEAVSRAGGWNHLIRRGREQFDIHCAACHGTSGRGGAGPEAHGILGVYGISIAPADLTGPTLQSQPDGQLFDTITRGKGAMAAYGHQVKVQDRWAIVAYLRVLQFARSGGTGTAR